MPGVDFNVLRAEITIEQVLDLIGFQPSSRRSSQWYGPCPLHDSSSSHPRCFSVNIAIGRYYCHQCHHHGNQLELWAAFAGLPLHQAAIDLCYRLDRDITWIHRP